MCGAGDSLPASEAASLLQAVQQRFTALCAALHSVLVCQEAGPSLRDLVSAAAEGLLDASSGFVNSLANQVAHCPNPCEGLLPCRCDAARLRRLDCVCMPRVLTGRGA